MCSSDLEPPQLSDEAKAGLVQHNYEGNIRELRSILLRALFFRRKQVISGEAIRQAIVGAGLGMVGNGEPSRRGLTEQIAVEIMERIRQGGDFWQDVYEPFSRSDISRDVVRLVVEKGRAAAGRPLPGVARYLRAIPEGGASEEQRRMLYKFKNFLYKTVKI